MRERFAVFTNWQEQRKVVSMLRGIFDTYDEAAGFIKSNILGSTKEEPRWFNIEKIWTDEPYQ